MPSLDRLEVLESLLRTKSPTASARELGVTQSAVSKTLAILRDELADPLLLRRGDTMVLTPRAERLLAPLSSSLNALRSVLADTAEPSGPATATVALRDQFVVALGPAILRIVAKESPRTVVRFLAYERERVADDLARGSIDVAVAVDPPEAPGLRQSVPLSRDVRVRRTATQAAHAARVPRRRARHHGGPHGLQWGRPGALGARPRAPHRRVRRASSPRPRSSPMSWDSSRRCRPASRGPFASDARTCIRCPSPSPPSPVA